MLDDVVYYVMLELVRFDDEMSSFSSEGLPVIVVVLKNQLDKNFGNTTNIII